MYWWNASKLADDLREGRVDEKERFKYFLATFFAWSLLVHALFFFSKVQFSIETLIFPAVNLTVIVLGIILCYRINRSGDNTDFVGRIVCLGWPVGIWFGAYFSPFFLISAYIGDWNWFSGIMWGLGLFYISSYYRAVGGQLAFIAKAEPAIRALQTAKTEWTRGKVLLGILGGIGIFGILFISLRAEPAVSGFVGEVLANVLTYLPLAVVWLILVGPDFLRLWRSSPKHPG